MSTDGKGPDDRDVILRRRARLIAAALATAGISATVSEACEPKPCLEPASVPEPDAGRRGVPPSGEEAGAGPVNEVPIDDRDAEPNPPEVCLSPSVCLDVEAEPRVCLSEPEMP